MTFQTQPLGIAWISALNRAIEFVDLSINRWRELKASQYDVPGVPAEIEQFFQAYQRFMPDWVVTFDDLAQFFLIPEDELAIATGSIILDELRFIRQTMQQLPKLSFTEPIAEPEPEPNPSTTECERLIAAIENLNLKPGLTALEIRQIIVEELQPIASEILTQGHNTRVELKEARQDAKLAVSALYPYADQDAEVRRSVFQGFFAIWNFPKAFPKSFVTKFEDGKPLQPETKQINNLMDFFEWAIIVFEEILGEFPSSIEFVTSKEEKVVTDKNGNPVLDANGNPKTELKVSKATTRFPNVAEILSEIVPLTYQAYTNTEKLLELSSKTLIEAGASKVAITKNFYRLKAIEKAMGLVTKADTKSVPLAFTAGQKNLLGFSKPSTTDIEIVEWDGSLDQQEIFRELLFAAKIIRGVYWQPLPNEQESAKAKIKEIIGQQNIFDEKLTEKVINNENESYRKIERAFTDEPGIGDTTDYWGGTLENTVSIRKIINNPENPG
ncbi:hypothetical protein [Coleofasciculus sp. E2-BRE-01]|uniref:hypothetical protein n=1 Tax=Coleofasciculus sp. E2-BRE-01 TaxID=3069524 RepID=UPI0032FB609F